MCEWWTGNWCNPFGGQFGNSMKPVLKVHTPFVTELLLLENHLSDNISLLKKTEYIYGSVHY